MKLEEQIIKVYKNEHGYFTRLSKFNNLKQEWEVAFVYLQFIKDIVIEDKTTIDLLDGKLTFYISKDNKVVLYVFIKEFNIVSNNE